MENVDGFRIEREGDLIHISFFDIFGMGEVYTFTVADARRIKESLHSALGPWDSNIAAWESEGGSVNDF